MKKLNKGITLIPLVITIVILLILSSIAVTMVLDKNGLLAKTQYAKNSTLEAKNAEEVAMNDNANVLDSIQLAANTDTEGKVASDVIYEGTADTLNTQYELTKSVEDYSYVLILTGLNGNDNTTSLLLPTSEITYGMTSKCVLSSFLDTSAYYSLRMGFNDKTHFTITVKKVGSGWNAYNPKIYKIIGIK